MKLSKLIRNLQEIENYYGDLGVYEQEEFMIRKYERIFQPTPVKLYYQKWEDAEHMRDELTEGDIETPDEELYDIDLTKTVKIGLLL